MLLESIVLITVIAFGTHFYLKSRQKRQLHFIKSYQFHPTLQKKVLQKYPHLTESRVTTVFEALRDYFTFCNQANKRMVAMPSQVVDVAWHEFILFTRAYELFSRKAIGRFLHHTPTEAMKSQTVAQESIKRAWRLACAKERISPKSPHKLPLLFAIDSLLNIEDGFIYVINCKDKSSPTHDTGFCAGHIGCASGCGGGSVHSAQVGDGIFGDGGGGGGGCGGGCGGS